MIVSCGEALVDIVSGIAVPGGGPMNTAIAAARLEAPAAFVGRVSTDDHGELIVEHLRSNGVNLNACERGDEPTARAIVEHTPNLAFRFEGNDTADTRLGPVDLSVLGAGPHIVHGGTLGLFRGRTADHLADLVTAHTGIVSLDPNVRPQIIDDRTGWDRYHQRWLDRAHVYKGSDEDFGWIWPGRSTSSCAEELLAGPAELVIETRGSDGAVLYTSRGEVLVPGREVDVADTVGAGDTFIAAVLVSLWDLGLAGDPAGLAAVTDAEWRRIGDRAVAAAGVTVSRVGADPPRVDELPL